MANEREPNWVLALMLFAAMLGVFVEAHALDLLKEAYRVESSVHLSNLSKSDIFPATGSMRISDGGLTVRHPQANACSCARRRKP